MTEMGRFVLKMGMRKAQWCLDSTVSVAWLYSDCTQERQYEQTCSRNRLFSGSGFFKQKNNPKKFPRQSEELFVSCYGSKSPCLTSEQQSTVTLPPQREYIYKVAVNSAASP